MSQPSPAESDQLAGKASPTDALRAELASLRERLREAEETLDAIRNGDVDAVVVSGKDDVPRVYTLETADESYRLLVQEMHEGALTLTGGGDVLYCNRSFADMVGSESGKIIGGSLRSFAIENWPRVLHMIRAEDTGEIEILSAGGRSLPVHISFSALKGGNFLESGIYCCIVTDLTQQRDTNDQLRLTHDSLLRQVAEREHTERLLRQSQKMEAIGQLTGGVAHDFNNLLMVIAGGLSILNRDPTPERRQKIQASMTQAATRGATLTRQLLAFSRQKELIATAIVIPRHIEGMRELLDGSLGADLAVETHFDVNVWPVHVDEGEFEIALLNLCVNARDAMRNGGVITIAARNLSNYDALQLQGDFVQLSVTDTGDGMDSETISRCLEPFYTTKEIGKGSGLGLAQVYGFAQGSGGAVQIDSQLQAGTTVSLFLPRALVEATVADIAPAELQNAPPLCRVLLVEDDHSVAALTSEMLLELGYQVARADSGRAGLERLLAGRDDFGAVLSDVMMPGGMDGLQFAQKLRTADINLPVVLVSGRAESIRRDTERAGILLLAKPYRLDELGRALATVLARNPNGRSPAPSLS